MRLARVDKTEIVRLTIATSASPHPQPAVPRTQSGSMDGPSSIKHVKDLVEQHHTTTSSPTNRRTASAIRQENPAIVVDSRVCGNLRSPEPPRTRPPPVKSTKSRRVRQPLFPHTIRHPTGMPGSSDSTCSSKPRKRHQEQPCPAKINWFFCCQQSGPKSPTSAPAPQNPSPHPAAIAPPATNTLATGITGSPEDVYATTSAPAPQTPSPHPAAIAPPATNTLATGITGTPEDVYVESDATRAFIIDSAQRFHRAFHPGFHRPRPLKLPRYDASDLFYYYTMVAYNQAYGTHDVTEFPAPLLSSGSSGGKFHENTHLIAITKSPFQMDRLSTAPRSTSCQTHPVSSPTPIRSQNSS
uniref:Uncharacterized protein n=1 Tax=Panagrellus redivivus TaxID=6233 RepID=A0A7E4ULR9_PANRE